MPKYNKKLMEMEIIAFPLLMDTEHKKIILSNSSNSNHMKTKI